VEEKKMNLQRRVVIISATISLLCCGAAREAVAYTEDFESYTNGMGARDIPGWNSPTVGGSGNGNYTVWTNSEITVTPGGNPSYGSAGYNNSQGLEAKFAGSGSTISQAGVLDTLSAGNVLNNSQPGLFSMQVRLTSYAMADTGNTNMTSIGPGGTSETIEGNSAILYLGSGMQWSASANKFFWTNATAFAVYFYGSNSGTDSNTTSIFTDSKAAEGASWQPGFGATLGTQPSWAYREDTNNTSWLRDTWYTVQLSNITLNAVGGQATNATALLSIYESSNPNIMLMSNVLITAQGGNSNAWGSSFTQINQIGLADAHANAVDDFDNIVLVPEPSTALLTLGGVFTLAMMRRRRQRAKE
jgi:hypothetical protein